MNKNTPLKSGWFFLWLVLTVLSAWGKQSDSFAWLESLNLKLLSKIRSVADTNESVARIVIPKQDGGNTDIYQSIFNDFPNATFILTSELNAAIVEKLNRLNIGEKVVVLSSSLMTSNRLSTAALADKFFLSRADTIRWSTLANLALAIQPNFNSNAVHAVVVKGLDIYPTLLTHALINYHHSSSKRNFHLENSTLLFDSTKPNFKQLKFGLAGAVYPLNFSDHSLNITELPDEISVNFEGLLLIDDLSNKTGKDLFRALLSIQQENYLVMTKLSYFAIGIFWSVLTFLMFSKKIRLIKRKTLSISFLLFSMLIIQTLLSNFSIWIPLQTLIILSVIGLLITIGIHREQSLLITTQKNLNEVLSETAIDFLRNQKAKRLLDLLQGCKPDKNLISVIREVATEAEAHQNIIIATQLYRWILSNDRKDTFSTKRLLDINKLTEPEELDQTIVIDGNAKISQQATSKTLLAIKNFGRYQVEGILGRGAMGLVFQGVDPKINRHVAIKTLQLNDDIDEESLIEKKKRFFREAETAGNLSHANIVTIYDVGEHKQDGSNQSLGYIAMDLLTGAPLSEFVSKDKILPPSLIYQLMIQMTDALDYAHRQKVIHRDIKPANIIFDDDLKRGTLTDFGIAYISDHSKTKTGTIMGSPYYMSPEQVMGQTVDGRSDVFSLGVTFYQLLSGQLPFNGESIATVAFHITKTKHESVRKLNKKLLTSSTRITNKAMQKDPAKRYQTMQEFRQALVNALKRDYKKSPI